LTKIVGGLQSHQHSIDITTFKNISKNVSHDFMKITENICKYKRCCFY